MNIEKGSKGVNSDNTMFDYLAQLFLVYGIAIICLVVFSVIIGEDAKGYSTMFRLGKEGISIETMVQYFLLVVVIITLKFLFFTDALIKKMSLAVRTVLMFALVIVAIASFIVMFRWFPVTDWFAWIMLFVSFVISATVSTVLSVLKEKADSRRIQHALEKMKNDMV